MLEAENYRQKSHTRTIDKFSNNQSSAELEARTNSLRYIRQRWLAYTPASRSKTGCASSTKGLAPPALRRKKQPPKPVMKSVPKTVPKSALQSPRSSLAVSAEPLARARQLTLRLQPTEGSPAAVRRLQHHRQDILDNTLQLQPSTASRITMPQTRRLGRSVGAVAPNRTISWNICHRTDIQAKP